MENLQASVTCVTRPSLLQRMRMKRQGIIEDKLISKQPLEKEIIPKLKTPERVKTWLKIALEEGHIQPSQATVGKLEGWPIRPYFKESLYNDFACWCMKEQIPTYLIPSQELFYQGADAIFDNLPHKKYGFPDLEICRQRFLILEQET
jgi:hypothetical protein